MCGWYGCKNCKFHKIYYSNDYWSPDEHECIISDNRLQNPDFEISDDEAEQVFDRVWTNGEEWNSSEEQICPYYIEYIPNPYD